MLLSFKEKRTQRHIVWDAICYLERNKVQVLMLRGDWKIKGRTR